MAVITAFLFGFWAGCGTDSPPAGPNNQNNGTCTNECTLGERVCLDSETIQTCIRNSSQPDCTTEITTACLTNEECREGDCLPLEKDCEDSCIPPVSRCTQAGEAETCADHDNDGCFEFGGAQACSGGDFCDQSSGLCRPSDCTDVCTQNATECQEGLLTTCFEGPEGCLIWGPGKECPEGQACMTDACVASNGCDDECTAGTSICSPDGGVRDCVVGNDGCARLAQTPTACPTGQSCRSGQCVPDSNCRDRCLANDAACVGNDLAECEVQSDGCLAFSNPAACPGVNATCSSASGNAQCEMLAVTGDVVINEVFYNPTGQDVRSGSSPVFIELFGPPGLSVGGFTIDLVNGSTGAPYSTFTLPNDARLDGNGFAVLAMTNADSFLSFAAPGNKYYILTEYASGQDAIQNGPDSVVLLNDSGTQVDAVGYGFQANDPNFAGEGTSAPSPTPGRSIGRKQGIDTDDNGNDFLSYYPTPGLQNADLIINEIYFDQPGTDDGAETFVELVAPIQGWEDLPLDGYVLRAINGFNGMDYIFSGQLLGIEMTSVSLNDVQDGVVVICNIDTADANLLTSCSVPFESTGDFQNGPDNFVLEYQGRVVDAVGYGNFSASNTFVGETSSATWSGSIAGQALGRWPISDPSVDNDTDNNSVDFRVVAPSPGSDNPIPTP